MKVRRETTKTKGSSGYYLTNNLNLREILSSGFIGGYSSFDKKDKYYKDLLAYTGELVPIFHNGIGVEFCELVREDDAEISFAVIIEIELSKDLAIFETLISDRKKVVSLVRGSIQNSLLRAVHFQNERELNEFAIRKYSNLPMPSNLFHVTPGLFQVEQNASMITLWLKKQSEGVVNLDEGIFDRLNHAAGAAVLCSYYAIQSGLVFDPAKVMSRKRSDREELQPSWFRLGFYPCTDTEIADLKEINDIIFAATIRILHDYDPNRIGMKLELLNEIETLIKRTVGDIVMIERVKKRFVKLRNIITYTESFVPFGTDSHEDAFRGLLLFLLRDKYEDLLGWDRSETNASEYCVITALAYSGIVYGRKSIPIIYRPEETDSRIAHEIVRISDERFEKIEKSKASGKRSKITDHQQVIDIFSNKPSKEEAVSANSVRPVITQQTTTVLPTAESDELAILCLKLGWSDCVTLKIHVMSGGSLHLTCTTQPEINISGKYTLSFSIVLDAVKGRLEQNGTDIKAIDNASLLATIRELASKH